ncbi:Protein CBR-DPY-20 [Caenorhabditis briggsae]|uniref:Protein dumpy-20 n=1 Tax=Caenorhabditis briggsae TaxID=6238 RepID=DPY20_CAEBR|nr:Protein CBR-DPY-20 [Caenorhabditis briggsae]P51558.2 RecName: Full=Protein dumpy-20 [Caenorhabditis briggsae]CAP26287.1 Protein CBR-DPY-20 [Caenorhabditis briggsae]
MDGHSNTSVILHTYQQQQSQLIPSIIPQTLPDGYGLTTTISQPDFSGTNAFINTNPWNTTTFPTYRDNQYTNEVSVLNYPTVYDDFSKESTAGTLSDPSLHGSNSSSSTSDVGSSVDCSISPEPILMPCVKRGRPTENPCWAYFHRIDDQLVKCRLCTKVVRSACATNMTKHLERHHTDDYQKVTGQLKLFRMNDAGIRSKMHYQVADTPLTPIPVLPNSYVLPKMDPMEAFDASQYYTMQPDSTAINAQPFPQFDQPQTSADSQTWPLTHFWPNGAQNNMMPQLGEPSTSAIGASVIQEIRKLNLDSDQKRLELEMDQNRRLLLAQKADEKGRVVKTTTKPYQKRNRKTEHPVWAFFKRTGDGNAECIICQGVVKSPCSSNFMRHLMRHHSTEYNDVYLKWIEKRNVTHPGIHCTSVPPPISFPNKDNVRTEPIFTVK